MGKQKRQKHKAHKENPTGLPSIKDFDELSEEFTNEDREKALQKVYEDVQAPNVEEKLSGLQTLESMAYDSTMATKIATNGITKIIGPLLVDHSIPVRAATASALRYIAENGGEEAYKSLLKDDIMTPLSALLKMFDNESLMKTDAKQKSELDDKKETFVQSVTLLWTLSENNESVIKCANENDIVTILLRYLDTSVYDTDINTVAAQCLLILSEDNPAATTKISQYKESLLSLLKQNIENKISNADALHLRTLSAGLLMNIINCTESNSLQTICQIVSVLSETLSIDHVALLNELALILSNEKDNLSSSSRKKIQQTRKIFGAQQQALEILANLCSEDEDSEASSDLDDSDTIEEDSECMDDEMTDDKSFKTVSSLPIEVVEAIINSDVIKRIWEKSMIDIDKTIEKDLQKYPEGKAVCKQIHTLRCRAYLCLNNLISTLDIDTLGGVESVYKLWSEIGVVIFKDTDAEDIELLESATSAMRAALHKLAEVRANPFKHLLLSDIQPMLNGERQCANSNVRTNLISILGNLALILVNDRTIDSSEIVQHISAYLLNICTKESEVWIMAESLDAIMDIYAEDETDKLAADIHLVEKLQALVPLFKTKVRQNRKHLGDNISVVSTVNTNITRFIKYKQKQLRNFVSRN